MNKISATRDQIIEMLKSGEIVFAADCDDDFLRGEGIIIHDNEPAYALRRREREYGLVDYGKQSNEWYVDYGKPFEFQVGDICEFGGLNGTVIAVRCDGLCWRSNELDETSFFFPGGFVSKSHTKPLLNFIRRPKKKLKKTIEIVTWVEVDEKGKICGVASEGGWDTPEGHKLLKSIATTEIEVEE